MNRKGESSLGGAALVVVSLLVVTTQMQLSRINKRVYSNDVRTAIDSNRIAKNADSVDTIKDIFWKQSEGFQDVIDLMEIHRDSNPVKEHGHIGMYGPVRRGDKE